MNTIRIIFLVFFYGLSTAACTSQPQQQTLKLIVSKQSFDYESPWLSLNTYTSHYYGTVIDSDMILTSAEAVQDHTVIEAQPYGTSKKIPLTVKLVDYEANLALLKISEELKDFKLSPVGILKAKPKKPKLIVAKDSQSTDAIDMKFLKAEIKRSNLSHYSHVHLIFETTRKNLGRAEPILDNGKLVALAVGQSDNLIKAIPAAMIQHVLDDQHDQNYKGFVKLGVFNSSIVDPNLKASLGIPEDVTGVLAQRIIKNGSAEGVIQTNDVITHIEGYAINEQGEIDHPTWGFIHFSSLLSDKYGGDTIDISILRENKSQTVEVPLKTFSSNLGIAHVVNSAGERDYRLLGGLILQEFSAGFLKTWGKNWQKAAPANFLYAFLNNLELGYTSQRRVILNKVMADPGNKGYEHGKYKFVNKVNGIEVRTLKDVDAAVKQPMKAGDQEYFVIELEDGAGQIVLKSKNITDIDARVRMTYNLP